MSLSIISMLLRIARGNLSIVFFIPRCLLVFQLMRGNFLSEFYPLYRINFYPYLSTVTTLGEHILKFLSLIQHKLTSPFFGWLD
jgi:hypothetical protein